MKNVFILFVSLLCLISCGDSCDDGIDLSLTREKVDLERIDQQLRNSTTLNDVKELLNKDQQFSKIIIPEGAPFEEFAYKIYRLSSDSILDSLYQEVDKVYGDPSNLENELADMFARVKHYYPSFHQPTVKGFVSAFGGYDLIQTEKMILIGLDYFLGPQPRYYDNNFPSYILKYYTKDQLPVKISMSTSSQFNKFDREDNTVLAHMIYYGKAFYFTKQMLPCIHDSIITEYSPQEFKLLNDDPAFVWQHFVSNKLFYNTDRAAIQKYIDDRPKTFEIGENSPGRVGRWLGYELVKSYMKENPDVTLQELMVETDAKKIFNESHYHPKSGG